jgi:hypothetical protein
MAPKRKPPPPPKGNQRNLVHGAHVKPSAAAVKAKRAALKAGLAASVPVKDAADDVALTLLATTLCRLDSVGEWLDAHGPLDRKGKPRSAASWERRYTSAAMKQLAALGMTPASRAKLGVNLARAVDLAQALSEPDEQRRTALLADAGLAPTGGQPLADDAQEGSLAISDTQNENDI